MIGPLRCLLGRKRPKSFSPLGLMRLATAAARSIFTTATVNRNPAESTSVSDLARSFDFTNRLASGSREHSRNANRLTSPGTLENLDVFANLWRANNPDAPNTRRENRERVVHFTFPFNVLFRVYVSIYTELAHLGVDISLVMFHPIFRLFRKDRCILTLNRQVKFIDLSFRSINGDRNGLNLESVRLFATKLLEHASLGKLESDVTRKLPSDFQNVGSVNDCVDH